MSVPFDSETAMETSSEDYQENTDYIEESIESSSKVESSEAISESEIIDPIIYNSGEEILLANSSGQIISVTFNSASANSSSLPSYITNTEYYDSSRILTINFTYKNYDLPELFRVSTHDLQVYDESGHALERISMQDGQDEVSAGRSADSTVYFYYEDASKKPEKIQIDYVPNYDGSVAGTAELDVEQ